jgi:hypothetical protein
MTMHMTQRAVTGLTVACVLGIGVPAVTVRAAANDDDKKITLTGCLVKGEGEGAGYLLTNTPSVAVLRDHDAKVEPGVVGTAGVEPVFYWLTGDRSMKNHVGHQVEIKGEMKGDVKEGEITLDHKAKWTEMTVKSDGRSMRAEVPSAIIYPSDHDDQKARILVRKVDVDHISMLGATCEE